MNNILWYEDEPHLCEDFKEECELEGMKLVPFRTADEAIDAFEKDMNKWDAVLLDVKGVEKDSNEKKGRKGFHKLRDKLNESKFLRNIPIFISTGETKIIEDEEFGDSFEFYIKSIDDERLINDMLKEIKKSDLSQIKFIYKDVFDSLESMNIIEYTGTILIDILLPLHFLEKTSQFKPVHHYTQLRKLLEYIFQACNIVGLIPDKCKEKQKINLNQSSIYLAGKDAIHIGVRYGKHGERIVPEYIESIICSILEFGNIHSHTADMTEEDTSKIEAIFESAKSKYIIYGLSLLICEVIKWFADYIPKHNDKEFNQSKCIDFKSKYVDKQFTPIKDENGRYHCDECFVPIKEWKNSKEKITITELYLNSQFPEKNPYPYFAKYRKI